MSWVDRMDLSGTSDEHETCQMVGPYVDLIYNSTSRAATNTSEWLVLT